jgi:hypothetical protein
MLRKALNGRLSLSQQVCILLSFRECINHAYFSGERNLSFLPSRRLRGRKASISSYIYLYSDTISQALTLRCMHSGADIALLNTLLKAQDRWRVQNQRAVWIHLSDLLTEPSKICPWCNHMTSSLSSSLLCSRYSLTYLILFHVRTSVL